MPNIPDPDRAKPVRVLLADDHELYTETLELLLALDDRVEVVGRAASGAQAIALAVGLQPDVVLMDVHMPCVDGIRATRAVKALLPGIRVVMLSSSAAVEDVERARDAGASGYLTKDAPARRSPGRWSASSPPRASPRPISVRHDDPASWRLESRSAGVGPSVSRGRLPRSARPLRRRRSGAADAAADDVRADRHRDRRSRDSG